MEDYKVLLSRLSNCNKEVMRDFITLFDSLEDHELVLGKWHGDGGQGHRSSYLRHNVVGKQVGKGIYFNSWQGHVLEVSVGSHKFFFGERVHTDEFIVAANAILFRIGARK